MLILLHMHYTSLNFGPKLIFLQEEIVNIKRLKEDKLERRDEMLDQLEDLLL